MHAKKALAGLAATLATGGIMLTSAPAASAAATPAAPGGDTAAVSKQARTSAVWKNVWHTAPSYNSGTGGPTGGHLNAGDNYFYCQDTGMQYSDLGYTNNWWLLTDDDSGNQDVWVNAVYVSGGSNNEPIPEVPHC